MKERLILASASPQRKTLLAGLGLKFDVIPSEFGESDHPEKDPVKRALVLAKMKAEDVYHKTAVRNPRSESLWVIGCDTLVVSPDGDVFEKPNDAADARRMIQAQSGRTSVVHSGLCLIAPDGRQEDGVSSSDVTFKKLSENEIEWWIKTHLWEGRSGSFQIDGLGQLMIEEIRGDWTSIVGFPVFLFGELMGKMRVSFLG